MHQNSHTTLKIPIQAYRFNATSPFSAQEALKTIIALLEQDMSLEKLIVLVQRLKEVFRNVQVEKVATEVVHVVQEITTRKEEYEAQIEIRQSAISKIADLDQKT